MSATVYLATVVDPDDLDTDTVLYAGSVYRTLEAAQQGAQEYTDVMAAYMADEGDASTEGTQLVWQNARPGEWYAYDDATERRHMIREMPLLG